MMSYGRIQIPKEIRDDMKLKTGDTVLLDYELCEGSRLILTSQKLLEIQLAQSEMEGGFEEGCRMGKVILKCGFSLS